MNRYIQKLIQEQFNIGNIDLNSGGLKHNMNVFNKNIINPDKIYNKLSDMDHIYKTELHIPVNHKIQDYEIEELDNIVAAVRPSEGCLSFISIFYSHFYPTHSLNWLDVSQIKNMSRLFGVYSVIEGDMCNTYNNKYNGDISKWDTSNVNNMEWTFFNSIFNGDISNWDVSDVKSMKYMFYFSEFNGDISGWDVSNVTNMHRMFMNSNFNHDIS